MDRKLHDMKEAKHEQLNKEKFNKWADTFDDKSLRTAYLQDAQCKLLPLLDVKENVIFVDIGCGTGRALEEAAKLVNLKGLFYGVDLAEKMIEKARSNFHGKHNFHFLQANAESIPLNDNFFDIIICTHSFHHYLNPDKALSQMHRLLKKNGRLYILDTNADHWIIHIIDKIIKLLQPAHVKFYSTEEFRQLFEQAGLIYVHSRKINVGSKVHIGEK